MQSLPFNIFTPSNSADIAAIQGLFREYAQSLGIDLCFQDFEAELASLPGAYAAPRGALIAARYGEMLAGCCALRPLDSVNFTNAAEMKRLYLRPEFRGKGLGRALAESILDAARQAGYAFVLLDTLTEMETARALYQDLGFVEIAPYYHNPIEGAHYLMATL